MVKNKIYLITYKEQSIIEGFVYAKKDFIKWLSQHNKQRRINGEIIEHKEEFIIEEVAELI